MKLFFYIFLSALFIPSIEACPFCDPAVLAKQAFYEEELAIALYNYKPAVEGHCLIIPRRHIERFEDLTDEELLAIGRVIKKVHQAVSTVFHTDPYLLMQKNGYQVGQSVPHIHFHYVPRKADSYAMLPFVMRILIAHWRQALSPSELSDIIDRLREAAI